MNIEDIKTLAQNFTGSNISWTLSITFSLNFHFPFDLFQFYPFKILLYAIIYRFFVQGLNVVYLLNYQGEMLAISETSRANKVKRFHNYCKLDPLVFSSVLEWKKIKITDQTDISFLYWEII